MSKAYCGKNQDTYFEFVIDKYRIYYVPPWMMLFYSLDYDHTFNVHSLCNTADYLLSPFGAIAECSLRCHRLLLLTSNIWLLLLSYAWISLSSFRGFSLAL